jgi:hypothetical protein
MSAVAIQQDQGCYDLRGRDFETALCGPITPSIIDADRLVRLDWVNGFPNWELYRVVVAGDTLHMQRLKDWTVALSLVYCADSMKRETYSDELACVVAWDALFALLHSGWMQPHTVMAEALEVHESTYKRMRDGLHKRLRASLDEYWVRLGAAYRHVILYERFPERGRR